MIWSRYEQRCVADFHARLNPPRAEGPTMLAHDRLRLRWSRIEEESRELLVAANEGEWLGMIDALVDIVYFTYGTAVGMGVDLRPSFDEVHRANLEKTPSTSGEKPAKPGNWHPPDVERVIRNVFGYRPIPSNDGD